LTNMEDMIRALRSIADELRFLANELNEKEKDEIEKIISKTNAG